MLTSIALPIVVAAGFCLIAIVVRVRGLAITLSFVVLGLGTAWFASEAFRRSQPTSWSPRCRSERGWRSSERCC